MGDLSKNFSRWELECPCCRLYWCPSKFLEALQAFRDLVGKPVRVTSCCRCELHNRKVSGASNSQHLRGTAADLVVRGMTARQLYRLASQIPAFEFGGIGVYPSGHRIHVDVRHRRSRWGKWYGRYVSVTEALRHEKPVA